jgi:hypothetical protein
MVTIEAIYVDGSVDLIEGYEGHFKKLSDILADKNYLEQLSDDTLYQIYRASIRHDHVRPFLNFSEYNRDSYHRLKYRSINA